MDENLGVNWPVHSESPPRLTSRQWALNHLLAATFLIMAVAQLVSFKDFANSLGNLDFTNPGAWGSAIIFSEFLAAAGLSKVPLSRGFRAVSNWMALLAALFWFVDILRAASDFAEVISNKNLISTNFFGKYLTQPAGWWAVIETTAFVFLVVYALANIKAAELNSAATKRKAGKRV